MWNMLIRDIMRHGEIEATKIASNDNINDPFAKSLTGTMFNRHMETKGVRCIKNLLIV